MPDLSLKLSSATLTMDARRLRDSLDHLRTALARPFELPSSPSAGTLARDRQELTQRLGLLLRRLDDIDLTAVQALSGLVREYRTEHQTEHLRSMFEQLQRGWRDRVRRILGPHQLPVVARLLASPAPDLLHILGREDDENSHSDLIAWLLTPRRAPIIAPHALRRLADRLGDEAWKSALADAVATGTLSVRREVVLARELGGGDDLARVDLALFGPGFVLAIENKVWSKEHGDQTTAYWRWLEPLRCLRAGIFLSPSGMNAACPEFRPVSYLELVSYLVEGASIAPISNSEEIVLASYLKTLAREIISVELRALRELANLEGA